MPRISVVVPIYNVESYLAECLQSLVDQTFRDFEAIVVDDGSQDRSRAIAEEFAARDDRFRIVEQPNGGLGKARNTGAEHAGGEFLAFVDSDDVLPEYAYQMLIEALDETGSDFATGNVHRLTRKRAQQSPFLADAFAKTRLATHVTQFRALLADRIVPNKLWRRSFWDAHGYRFPEGMLHEDIPVVVPAHFAARSVDVIAEPVYLYRIREGEDLSITQRRVELKALNDRMTAIERVSAHLEREGPRDAKHWYDESVVADDLRYYANVLDVADEEYRAQFLDRVNAFLDKADEDIYDPLPALERLKWHLLRRRLMPEYLEVLRFQKEDRRTTPPVQSKGRWYGDYPFRGDARLQIPDAVYELGQELELTAQIEELRHDGDKLQIEGFAYIGWIGAAERDTQRVEVTALRRGRRLKRFRRIRLKTSGIRFHTEPVERPDVVASTRQSIADLTWSGFVATIDPRQLRTLGRWRTAAWDIFVTVRSGNVGRRTARFSISRARQLLGVDLPLSERQAIRLTSNAKAGVTVEVRDRLAVLRDHRLDANVLELTGEAHMPPGDERTLEVVRRSDELTLRFPLPVEGDRFEMHVPLADLRSAAPPAADAEIDPEERTIWDLEVVTGDVRQAVVFPDGVEGEALPYDGRELVLQRTRRGDAVLVERDLRPVAEQIAWTDDGALELSGRLPATVRPSSIVVSARQFEESWDFPLERDDAAGRFSARIAPAATESLAGRLPLREGTWDVYARPEGTESEEDLVPVMLDQGLNRQLPLRKVVDHKPFALGETGLGRAFLMVQRDLDDDERGAYNQRVLRETAYVTRRVEPLRDTVVYDSFNGRQYSDSPRAIHEELVRRDAPLDHLWVVRDGMCEVPASARVLRAGSREHLEALAQTRYVVTNDHFPDWFARRPEQVCLQTWHGTPLKRLGLDVSETRKQIRRFQRRWDQQVDNWQYVLSPNPFSTPILRRAYAVEGEMLETGYPRSDVLARSGLDEATRRMRRRLGVPEDARVVLYAPTYRDHVVDSRGRYRLDLHLDLDRLHAALGPDTVLLFRKHHYVADAVPAGPNGFVRDVSSYPDGTELLLAADVLVTDYSSIMFDFANTGRPMLFFTYDLATYQDEIRGFYLDYTATVPGPLLKTTDELAGALNAIDSVRSDYAPRYDEFRREFCTFDDGQASARVVDRLFEL
jgi:CDP-glycerol glycerophosphotransferase